MANNGADNDGQAARWMSSFLRRLLGTTSARKAGGVTLAKTPLPKMSTTSTKAATDAAPRTMPRQLSSEEYAARTGASGSSGSVWSALEPPILGLAGWIGGLFGGSSSTKMRYREQVRAPFHLVEAISPETQAAIAPLNEAASGLFGVVPSASGGTTGNSLSRTLMNDRQAVTSAVRRSVGETGAICNVLNEYQDGL
jgi:hypothetical protein